MSRRTNGCVFNNKEPEHWRQPVTQPRRPWHCCLPEPVASHTKTTRKRENSYFNDGGVLILVGFFVSCWFQSSEASTVVRRGMWLNRIAQLEKSGWSEAAEGAV